PSIEELEAKIDREYQGLKKTARKPISATSNKTALPSGTSGSEKKTNTIKKPVASGTSATVKEKSQSLPEVLEGSGKKAPEGSGKRKNFWLKNKLLY
ncbi:MAG TPA: hypothetical protein PKN48_16410, partial [Bacteroidales bacterium]|nr:hypothetical protein [Bacteroidales bacterium]